MCNIYEIVLNRVSDNGFAPKPIKYYVDKNGCYVCVSHYKDKAGYPTITRRGKLQYLHRCLYEEDYGPLLSEEFCCHSCDNPACINLAHVFVGSHRDNMADMAKKGRGMAKLTSEDVSYIREICPDMPLRKLASYFQVSTPVINKIKKKQTYKFVEE